jgi:hypothetical protein
VNRGQRFAHELVATVTAVAPPPPTDTDGNGVADASDNCTTKGHADQRHRRRWLRQPLRPNELFGNAPGPSALAP